MKIKVEEVMTPDPVTLLPMQTVADAYALMRDRGFRHVPIVEAGVLLGVISATDIGRLGAQVPAILAYKLHEVMITNLITIRLDETVAAAAATMASRKINCLLVVTGDRLEGIVTTYDLLDAFARRERDE